MIGVDWIGFEEEKITGWQRKGNTFMEILSITSNMVWRSIGSFPGLAKRITRSSQSRR